MNFLRKAIIALVVIVGLLYAGSFMLPAEYGMERSISIDAKPEIVYNQINELKNWPSWSPWTAADPAMEVTYSSVTSGRSAWYSWDGPQTGTGKLTILKDLPYESLEMQIDFGDQKGSRADWIFEADAAGTTATWKFQATAPSAPYRYMGLMIDAFLGPMYEDGLQRLKKVSEAIAANQQADDSPAPESTPSPDSENP